MNLPILLLLVFLIVPIRGDVILESTVIPDPIPKDGSGVLIVDVSVVKDDDPLTKDTAYDFYLEISSDAFKGENYIKTRPINLPVNTSKSYQFDINPISSGTVDIKAKYGIIVCTDDYCPIEPNKFETKTLSVSFEVSDEYAPLGYTDIVKAKDMLKKNYEKSFEDIKDLNTTIVSLREKSSHLKDAYLSTLSRYNLKKEKFEYFVKEMDRVKKEKILIDFFLFFSITSIMVNDYIKLRRGKKWRIVRWSYR